MLWLGIPLHLKNKPDQNKTNVLCNKTKYYLISRKLSLPKYGSGSCADNICVRMETG